jgi:hypothetical protein
VNKMTIIPSKNESETPECSHEKLTRIKIYAVEIAEAILFLAFVLVWLVKELRSLF